jgi:hypothetical protein
MKALALFLIAITIMALFVVEIEANRKPKPPKAPKKPKAAPAGRSPKGNGKNNNNNNSGNASGAMARILRQHNAFRATRSLRPLTWGTLPLNSLIPFIVSYIIIFVSLLRGREDLFSRFSCSRPSSVSSTAASSHILSQILIFSLDDDLARSARDIAQNGAFMTHIKCGLPGGVLFPTRLPLLDLLDHSFSSFR